MDQSRFEILEILGTGNYGAVCLARDRTAPGERVVLKVLKKRLSDNEQALTRLRDEAKVLARLRHPNIVRVYRLLEQDGRPVVVMEHVNGCSLHELLGHQREGLPPAEAIAIVHGVALALDAAYNTPAGPEGKAMRIVHRDVKPANILLSVDGKVKVVDFGIAKGDFEDRESETRSVVLGSQGYTAPERKELGQDSPAVDVYALGVTLFELLSGRGLVQSMHPDRHDTSVDRFLEHVAPAGLPPESVTAIRDAIRSLVRYKPEVRPPIDKVAPRLHALLEKLGLYPDLPGYAAIHVGPIVDARPHKAPQDHAAWPEIAFLAEAAVMRDLPVETLTPWGRRTPSGEGPAAKARNDVEPHLAVLEQARPRLLSWFSKGVPPEKVLEALIAVLGSHDPRVLERATELSRHGDPRVAAAAKAVLARGTGS